MNNNIIVDEDAILQLKSFVESYITLLNDNLDEINDEIKKIKDVWVGTHSDAFTDQFEKFLELFITENEQIKDASNRHLDTVIENYSTVEKQVISEVQN